MARCRWYGDGDPQVCFMERKTHRESWKGEESVKERFTLQEEQVVPFLTGKLPLDDAIAPLRKKVFTLTSPSRLLEKSSVPLLIQSQA